jgi:acyl-coenzyme A synthetase/AMP-(fatty) acid ligase
MPRNDPDVSDGRPDDREHLRPAVNVQALRGGGHPASNKYSPLRILNQETYKLIQQQVAASPSAFWDPIARQTLHWFDSGLSAWLTCSSIGEWTGWDAATAAIVRKNGSWSPWQACQNDATVPVVRWFDGGQTNAAFNEVDRAVLSAESESTAFISDPGDGTCERMSVSTLLIQSVCAAHFLVEECGACRDRRVAFFLPNDLRPPVWIEAAKRLGVPYVAVASGTASTSLADRLADTGAAILVTCEALVSNVQAALQLMAMPPQAVLVPTSSQADERGSAQPHGFLPASAGLERAHARLLAACQGEAIESLPRPESVRIPWQLAAPRPVDASFPLFMLYTSGSTGKPKGIVHTHGGYQVGLCLTTQVVFDLKPEEDVFMVIATPGWITGQSYMIAASLLSRVPSIVLEGSPVSPPDRFAATIERHNVTVLKAGSTFLRMLMTMPNGEEALRKHRVSSLRIGTFCAEPVNEAVHLFAMKHLTRNYINSYWATEHGGIVWSRCFGNDDQPLAGNAHTWPLPWISAAVLVRTDDSGFCAAAEGEQGECVIRQRYPYQGLTVWQSAGFGTPEWAGDSARWGKYFEVGAGYVQGDAAICHTGGSYTFHGRSDEVMNVGGNRIGTEEIESALLADTQRDDSPLRNCVVVGIPDEVLGTVPVAFVVLQPGATLRSADEGRMRTLVQKRLSSVAVPKKFIVAEALPETYSGKFMRRILQKMLAGEAVGDLGACKNPDCVEPLHRAVRAITETASVLNYAALLEMV